MKYFIWAIITVVIVICIDILIVKNSPDHSVEAGLKRSVPTDLKQAEEDMNIWETQRQNKNDVPRH